MPVVKLASAVYCFSEIEILKKLGKEAETLPLPRLN
jgi:hypothetical protein